MYKNFDDIVAKHEAEAQAAANKADTPEQIAQRERFLASLPPQVRNNPDLLKSLKTSTSFQSFQKVQKTNITRDDVEAWARGEDAEGSSAVESDYSKLQSVVVSAIEYKQAGNCCFKKGELASAINQYTSGLDMLKPHSKAGNKQVDETWVAMLSNRAACYLSLEQFEAVILDCTVILRKKTDHVKALWRRSQALKATGDSTSAASDLRALLHIEPKNGKAKKSLKSMILEEKAKHDRPDRNGLNDDDEILFKKETKTLLKSIKTRDMVAIQGLLRKYVEKTSLLYKDPQWQIKMRILYTTGVDDAMLSLLSSEKQNGDGDDDGGDNGDGNVDNSTKQLLALVKELFNLGFARLMQYTDETDEDDDVPHFFGAITMSSRAQVRALLRTAMTGNKIQLERLKQFMAKTDALRRPQMWICNADRELMSRIRTNDTQGALFHAFEGEVYRHVARKYFVLCPCLPPSLFFPLPSSLFNCCTHSLSSISLLFILLFIFLSTSSHCCYCTQKQHV